MTKANLELFEQIFRNLDIRISNSSENLKPEEDEFTSLLKDLRELIKNTN